MFVALAICAAWTALCGSTLIASSGPVMGNQNEAIPGIEEYSTKTRTKRMVPIISKALLALTNLLSKSKGVAPFTMTRKNYMKHGDFGTAIQDFKKFGPTHIKHTKASSGVQVIEGRTEGFKLRIVNPGYRHDSDAMLEITEYATKKGEPTRTYIITYTHMKKDQIY